MIGLHLPAGPLVIACLAAHPDDVEIAAGGTLLQLRDRGEVRGYWLTLTGGPDRIAEGQAAAQAFVPGSTSVFCGLPDGRLPAYWDAVKDALHGLAESIPAPDLILAPRADDAHQDHRLLGELVSTVWRDSMVWRYEIPKWDGDLARPNFYLPMSAANAERKIALLEKHYDSQIGRSWWDRQVFLSMLRIRGIECRAQYAEAFTVTKATVRLRSGPMPTFHPSRSSSVRELSSPRGN